ncbi:N-acetylmuramoyl-L-alanine amidase [Cellulophaga lytica]|nr:N-acetylmuramoyl-L-alanine amidase [Cellulophaga lytica]
MILKKTLVLVVMLVLISVELYSQDKEKTVVAQKGEGIYTLLRKFNMSPSKYYSDFIALNKDNLRNGKYLYEGKTYIIPDRLIKVDGKEELPAIVNGYPIFGKKHATVQRKSNKLKGAVYYLISGHGGPDPGAVTKYGKKLISEDEYAYDITLRLGRELISHGALVYIIIRDENDGIRDGKLLPVDYDEVCYPNKTIPLNQVARLKQRVDAVNDLYMQNKGKYQRLIVTHIDSRSVGQNIDVFFYHHEKSSNGKILAESIHKTFDSKYREYQPNRDYTGTFLDRSGLYLVKNTIPAMAYIEIGNIKNKKDQKRILVAENRQALAKWISEGVLLDYSRNKN